MAGANYHRLGQYYANTNGPTVQYLRLPGTDGQYRKWLSWGYDIWGHGTESLSEPLVGWIASENLHEPPYNIPRDATAVRLHIKAKVSGVTWAENKLEGQLQASMRPYGGNHQPNEMIHATAQKPAGAKGETPYDLNHVEVDIPIGKDGRIEVFRSVSIIGNYMQIDLITYVAGYWR
ncbi:MULTISPECIES: hypothetical protein [Devosia]|uniref:hypothetical protein n=1 Tax=Devosia TaxID=46913 RepID=UPI00130025E4|nr:MULTISPECIES: hypothetical protein [Devosia]